MAQRRHGVELESQRRRHGVAAENPRAASELGRGDWGTPRLEQLRGDVRRAHIGQ